MTVKQMRSKIKDIYPYSHRWAKRVDAMKDNQVIAVYYNLVLGK